MHKSLALLFTLLFTPLAVAAPIAMTVSDTAVTILPARPIGSNVAWTNGITVVQGQIVTYENHMFFAESAGTSTNAPAIGATTGRLRSVAKGQRALAVIQNLGSVDVYLSFDGAAEASKGLKLGPNAVVSIQDISGAISAITASGSTSLGITEVAK